MARTGTAACGPAGRGTTAGGPARPGTAPSGPAGRGTTAPGPGRRGPARRGPAPAGTAQHGAEHAGPGRAGRRAMKLPRATWAVVALSLAGGAAALAVAAWSLPSWAAVAGRQWPAAVVTGLL